MKKYTHFSSNRQVLSKHFFSELLQFRLLEVKINIFFFSEETHALEAKGRRGLTESRKRWLREQGQRDRRKWGNFWESEQIIGRSVRVKASRQRSGIAEENTVMQLENVKNNINLTVLCIVSSWENRKKRGKGWGGGGVLEVEEDLELWCIGC